MALERSPGFPPTLSKIQSIIVPLLWMALGTQRLLGPGGKTSRTFFYNLDSDEFVKGGEVEIIVPNGWTRPAMSGDGKVVIEQVTSTGATIPDLADDAKPILTIRGQSIIVEIKEMDSNQSIKITYGRDGTEDNATAPTISGDSEFLVRSKTRAVGFRTIIAKNQVLTTEDSKVIVEVVDGASGSGRATSTLPGTVPSGSTNNTITFTFTATAQLSNTAEIRLQIPEGWAVPNISGGDQAPGTANVTITSSVGDGIDDTNNDDQGDESDARISGLEIVVPIDNLPPGQRITIIYGAGDNKAEAQGELPVEDLDDGVRYAKFIMSSQGGVSGDSLMPVGDPEDGVLKTIIGNAADGSLDTTRTTGLVTEQDEPNAPPADEGELNIADEVYAADTGIEITFTVVASGTMDGGAIRIVPPLGWTTPQGSPGVAGYTREESTGGNILGLPAFDGVGAVFNTVDFDVSDTNGVMIKYGFPVVAPLEQPRQPPKQRVVMRPNLGSKPKVLRTRTQFLHWRKRFQYTLSMPEMGLVLLNLRSTQQGLVKSEITRSGILLRERWTVGQFV